MAIGTALAIGAGIGAVSAGGQIGGSAIQAGAAEDIAAAQLEESRRTREAAQAAAAPSVQELQLLNRQIEVAERGIARQEKILAEVDPALMEAGRQALGLLQGQESKVLEPIRRERARQRETLKSTLRKQLGSGFETSSAGIEALGRFDEETASSLQSAQQAAIGQLLGTSVAAAGASGVGFQGVSALGIPLAGRQAIAQRTVSSILGTPIVGTSPEAAGQMALGQGISQAAAGLGQLGGTIAGLGIFQNALGVGKGNGLFEKSVAATQKPYFGPAFGPGGAQSTAPMLAKR